VLRHEIVRTSPRRMLLPSAETVTLIDGDELELASIPHAYSTNWLAIGSAREHAIDNNSGCLIARWPFSPK
jgi:hypothetical protein